jgi:hypothetical protein
VIFSSSFVTFFYLSARISGYILVSVRDMNFITCLSAQIIVSVSSFVSYSAVVFLRVGSSSIQSSNYVSGVSFLLEFRVLVVNIFLCRLALCVVLKSAVQLRFASSLNNLSNCILCLGKNVVQQRFMSNYFLPARLFRFLILQFA